jgi:hypothetical protein
MFNSESLVLEQVVFEGKFQHGYLYWDNCGKIWKDIIAKWPALTADNVSVQEAIMSLKDEDINLKFSHDAINITQKYPKNLKLLGDFADSVFQIITDYLKIETFSRIGNRFFYIYKVENSNESIDLLKKTGFFNIPQEKLSVIGDRLKDPHVKIVITKGEEIGYIFNLTHVERKVEISLPKFIKYDTSGFISTALSIDVDFYTIKPVDLSILRCKELIEKTDKNIRHIIKALFQ